MHGGDEHGTEGLEEKDPKYGKTSGGRAFVLGVLPRSDGDGNLRNDTGNQTSENKGSSPHLVDEVGSDSGEDKVGGSRTERDTGLRQGRGNPDRFQSGSKVGSNDATTVPRLKAESQLKCVYCRPS